MIYPIPAAFPKLLSENLYIVTGGSFLNTAIMQCFDCHSFAAQRQQAVG
jgi:hypothetical protein